jgi:hypothetical protein
MPVDQTGSNVVPGQWSPLWGGRQLPLPAPLGISWAFEWQAAATVEVLIGLLLMAFAVRRHSTSRTG